MRCAVLGPKGTFSEDAALLYWPQAGEIKVAPTIKMLFDQLIQREIDDILVPIDNSYAGSIDSTMQALNDYEVSIHGEIILDIEQCLLANNNYRIEELELLVSHPAALMQCSTFIEENLPDIRTEITGSTARAVQIVKGETRKAVAIGSSYAAELYGMHILCRGIENACNQTRFIHVRRRDKVQYEGDKGSLIFTLPDKPGALYQALEVFARRGINLCKIESRRSGKLRDSFAFYIEFDNLGQDAVLPEILTELGKQSREIKFLGMYSRDRRKKDVYLHGACTGKFV
ncbi:prephenate dehydratase [Thermosyntropha lipolytica DSM 11003]|uniref:Prephenate dehydratase n=1 Tax=Thermosyntropha lipolytica DSM 11003 TaxID=1123382 RepID=A0A1M5P084_9FIRM|nr:prephenate dehydratase [Thermosyntropha lipolytica]SHG95182.1 prephenate dehydratase [Thermosyntropha lipolytica DSM 11003]